MGDPVTLPRPIVGVPVPHLGVVLGKRVVAGAAHQVVRLAVVAAVQVVIAVHAVEVIRAVTAVQVIVAGAAVQPVVPRTAVQPVAAGPAVQDVVVGGAGPEQVGATLPVQPDCAGEVIHRGSA